MTLEDEARAWAHEQAIALLHRPYWNRDKEPPGYVAEYDRLVELYTRRYLDARKDA